MVMPLEWTVERVRGVVAFGDQQKAAELYLEHLGPCAAIDEACL